MDVTIEQTILVNRHEVTRHNSLKDKVICGLCCCRPHPPAANRSTKKIKRRSRYSRVRFSEPNKVEPIDDRQPSWESYKSWTSQELDEALEEFIYQTLITVRKSLNEDLSCNSEERFARRGSNNSDEP